MSRRSRANRIRPVLIVQHAPHEHAAALRRALETQGVLTRMIHPYRGDAYPAADEIAGIVSLGGPMGANDVDEYPWIGREIDLLAKCASAGLPVAGICLGGQMLARALGAKVERHSRAEVGWFPLEISAAGMRDRVLGVAGAGPMVYHWHGDTFHLPPGAELLASSQACERQAYRAADNVYGFQFHPEADHQLVLEWLAIEGMEEDIHEFRVRMDGCFDCVQEAKVQRAIALKGEKASLKITAAIATLFCEREAADVPASLGRDLQDWATRRQTVALEFLNSAGHPVHLQGRIDALLSIPAGQFVVLADAETLLWPVRTDDIRAIRPVEVRSRRPIVETVKGAKLREGGVAIPHRAAGRKRVGALKPKRVRRKA